MLITLAGITPDLDVLTILGGIDLYASWHQILGHNLAFCLVTSTLFALLSSNKAKIFLLTLIASHIHLALDWLGSGPGWGFAYLFPISKEKFTSLGQWELISWQNGIIDFFFVTITLIIAIKNKRFLLECPAPKVDQKIVKWLTEKR